VEDPPRLIIRNESTDPIVNVEFWGETPELKKIRARGSEALLKQFTDWENLPIYMATYTEALLEYGVVASKMAQTTPPLIEDATVIPSGGSCSWDLEAGETYIARVNNSGLFPVTKNEGSLDTVYVFDGQELGEER
jgi:hypothetical protein